MVVSIVVMRWMTLLGVLIETSLLRADNYLLEKDDSKVGYV